jgi:transcriptional regulator with XRE-family HTH domain
MSLVDTTLLNDPDYNPVPLLDAASRVLGVRNDRQLAFAIGEAPSRISRIRHKRAPVTAEILLRFHAATDLPIRTLRNLMGDTKAKYFGATYWNPTNDHTPSATSAEA